MGVVVRAALVALALWMSMGSIALAAGEIVYVGADGNVWSVAPDGAAAHRLTVDGTRDSPYRAPALTQDGTVAVLRDALLLSLAADGTQRTLSGAPNAFDVTPAGDHILSAFGTRITGSPEGDVDGYTLPRWLPTRDYLAVQGTRILVITRIGPRAWLRMANDPVSYDITRSGSKLLAQLSDGDLVYWDNDGAVPPDFGPQADVCTLAGFASDPADLSWSPDGASFTWAGPGGVYVSPAPDPATCALAPRLIVPGGSQPDWGDADRPALPPPPAPVIPATIVPAPALPAPAPTVRALRFQPATFTGSTRVTYRASATTRVAFTLERRVGKRYVASSGGFTRSAAKGINRFRFSGRALRPGVYRMTAAAPGARTRSLFAIRRSSR